MHSSLDGFVVPAGHFNPWATCALAVRERGHVVILSRGIHSHGNARLTATVRLIPRLLASLFAEVALDQVLVLSGHRIVAAVPHHALLPGVQIAEALAVSALG